MSKPILAALLMMGCLDPVGGDRDAADVGVDTADAATDIGSDVLVDDGGADVPDAPTVDSGACGVQIPDRPPLSDMIDAETMFFALRDIVLDTRDNWSTTGWDLDGRCTIAGDEHLCAPPGTAAPPLDGDGGLDNSFGQNLLPIITTFRPSFEADVNERMVQGETLLLLVRDWNGTPTDPRIQIRIRVVAGLNRVDGNTVPQWDGNDRWQASEDSPTTLEDLDAYVTDGIFVARLPDLQPIELPWIDGNRIRLGMTNTQITGSISGDRIENLWIQGRLGLPSLRGALEGSGICEGGVLRGLLDTEANTSLDLMRRSGTGGPDAVCDAISVAIQLRGYRAMGSVDAPPSPTPVVCIP